MIFKLSKFNFKFISNFEFPLEISNGLVWTWIGEPFCITKFLERRATNIYGQNHLILCPKFFGSCQQVFRLNTNPCPHFFNPLYHKTILTLKSPFCLKSNGILALFVEDYEPNQNLKLFSNSFKLVFGHIPPLYLVILMIWYLNIWMIYFHLEDFASGFSRLFQLCSRITHGHMSINALHISLEQFVSWTWPNHLWGLSNFFWKNIMLPHYLHLMPSISWFILKHFHPHP